MFYIVIMENLNPKILSTFKANMFLLINYMEDLPKEINSDIKKANIIDYAESLGAGFREMFFKEDDSYLKRSHICYENGHNMFNVFTRDNGQSVYGQHKCSRCGKVEDFQYDYR